jgi:hypothetical protein
MRYLIGMLLVVGLIGQTSDEANWNAFLVWLKAQPPNSKPADLINPYRDKLTRQGVQEPELSRQIGSDLARLLPSPGWRGPFLEQNIRWR